MEISSHVKIYTSRFTKNFSTFPRAVRRKNFVSRQTVSNWERGVSEPPLATLLAIANTFDVQLTTLLEHLHHETD
ncbi:Protein of unknown function [Leuconostoc citreum]|nr:Protein of unknown function [Leuconostoc citreum]